MQRPPFPTLIFAFDPASPFYKWARDTIAGAVAGDGAAINAVSLAEVCVGDADPPTVADRIRSWGVEILDVPAAAAYACATAYLQYRKQRMSRSDTPVPPMPLPDFSLALMPRSWAGSRHRGSGPVPYILPFRRPQDAAMTRGGVCRAHPVAGVCSLVATSPPSSS